MPVWSEIRLSSLSFGRLDAEYYEPALMKYERAVKNGRTGWKPLSEVADVITDGDHMKRDYQEEGVLFLTSENVTEHRIDRSSALRIALEYEKTLARARSEVGAVFLTKTGRWYGKAAVCLESEPVFNISADIAKIRLRPDYDPFFLACYLNSSVGYALVRRESTGASRDRIILANLRNLAVPIVRPSDNEYRKVVYAIGAASRKEAAYFAEAEALLMSALGLDKLDLTPRLSYERSFKDTTDAARLDAEYFQPKYQSIIDHIQRTASRCRTIGEIAAHCERGKQPDYSNDGKLAVITSQHILEGVLDYCNFHRTDAANWDKRGFARARIWQNDILTYTTGANIGRTAAYLTKDRALASNHVNLLRLQEEDPIYVAFVMNSMVGRMQTLMYASGSAQLELYPQDILRFVIPFVDTATQATIAKAVQDAYEARREARRLLDEAKALVEKAILTANGEKA